MIEESSLFFSGEANFFSLHQPLLVVDYDSMRVINLPNEGYKAVTHLLTIFLIATQVCRQKSLFIKQPGHNDQY